MALISAIAMAGCDSTPETPSEPSAQASASGQLQAANPSAPPTAPACPPTAELNGPDTSYDRQGTGDGATLWAMLFSSGEGVLRASRELKVAWRMTGSGDFSISATGPDGKVVKPVWGPEPHGSSNWGRPGDEWGTGWVFPTSGCWTINATRTSGTGSLALRVAE
ncbi:hypothetical protein [Micromonospora sp. NBC_01412]|uniref:hypothetical protein n=1 Tax=Micromonospora sp. NBC_01412 TaxID=2903590 RepID=UPI0032446C71